MTLEEFKQSVELMTSNEDLRIQYIDHFIDKENTYFKRTVSRYKRFSDGLCYEGFLWDCLKKPYSLVTQKDAEAYIKRFTKVLVLWDIHSKERILMPDIWKFKKDAVLSVDSVLLLQGLAFLPEDVYIFDRSFEWTAILTHEEDYKRHERLCMLKEMNC